MMISCKKANELMSKRMERLLTPWEYVSLRYHMSICDACQWWQKQIVALRSLLRTQTPLENPSLNDPTTLLSNEARQRISQIIKNANS